MIEGTQTINADYAERFEFSVLTTQIWLDVRNGVRRRRATFSYDRGLVMSIDAAVSDLYRQDWGRIVATLIRLTGDFDLAEEAAQEAFAAAVEQWARPACRSSRGRGSSRPRGTRRSTASAGRRDSPPSVELQSRSPLLRTVDEPDYDTDDIPDDRLRLIFTCCHPALTLEPRSR